MTVGVQPPALHVLSIHHNSSAVGTTAPSHPSCIIPASLFGACCLLLHASLMAPSLVLHDPTAAAAGESYVCCGDACAQPALPTSAVEATTGHMCIVSPCTLQPLLCFCWDAALLRLLCEALQHTAYLHWVDCCCASCPCAFVCTQPPMATSCGRAFNSQGPAAAGKTLQDCAGGCG